MTVLTPRFYNSTFFLDYTGYLTNLTINGLIAQQEKGATIVLEHRYYGLSNPYPDLSVESLQYHTIQQAIDDLEYFAKNVVLPMPNGANVSPDKAPWILVGGSYAGSSILLLLSFSSSFMQSHRCFDKLDDGQVIELSSSILTGH